MGRSCREDFGISFGKLEFSESILSPRFNSPNDRYGMPALEGKADLAGSSGEWPRLTQTGLQLRSAVRYVARSRFSPRLPGLAQSEGGLRQEGAVCGVKFIGACD